MYAIRSYYDLPFDLKHKRWPIQYELTKEIYDNKTKKKDVENQLVNNLYEFIRLIIDKYDGFIADVIYMLFS